jgi:hypothetical protein
MTDHPDIEASARRALELARQTGHSWSHAADRETFALVPWLAEWVLKALPVIEAARSIQEVLNHNADVWFGSQEAVALDTALAALSDEGPQLPR